MQFVARAFLGLWLSSLTLAMTQPARAESQPGVESRFADVNGTRLHYLIAGQGEPVILIHGYTQTSHMWRPLLPELAKTHTVLAPDLRGAGQSARPPEGYDKKTLAQDIHALAALLGYSPVSLVGHDIGLMVAYAYAAQYPAEVERIALMDAFLPGVGDWKSVWLLRDLWHFHFYGEVPLRLVAGRERIYFEHFWNDFAADRSQSVPEADRESTQRPTRSRAACAPASSTSAPSSRTRRTSRASRRPSSRFPCWCSPARRHLGIPDRTGAPGRERCGRRRHQEAPDTG